MLLPLKRVSTTEGLLLLPLKRVSTTEGLLLLPLKRVSTTEGLLLLLLNLENTAEGLLLRPLNPENTAKAPHRRPSAGGMTGVTRQDADPPPQQHLRSACCEGPLRCACDRVAAGRVFKIKIKIKKDLGVSCR